MSDDEHDFAADRAAATEWARATLAKRDVVILDTETTGLSSDAEIVQIAIITTADQVLLDTLVRPTRPIPPSATRIHGITDAMVETAPSWADMLFQIDEAVAGKLVVIYNAAYDLGVIHHCCTLANRSSGLVGSFAATACAMEMYAQWVGDWSSFRGSYRWQKLRGGDHTALGDARACLNIMRRMAEWKEPF